MNIFFEKLINFLYRKSCVICRSSKENSFLCSKCKSEIIYNEPIVLKQIRNCNIFSCSVYYDVSRQLIKEFKFKKKTFLAKEIAKISFNYLLSLNIDFSDFEIVCVPLYPKKQKQRGFNQCELIAKELSEMMKIPYNFSLITKIKNTKPMYNLNTEERKENLKGAFLVNKNNYHNKNLLLIDDITTTGATLEEVIKELNKNDIFNIICYTFSNTEL